MNLRIMTSQLLVKPQAQAGSSTAHRVPEAKTSSAFKRLSSKLFVLPAACPCFTDSKMQPWDGDASSLGPPACPPPSPEQRLVLQPPAWALPALCVTH